MSTLTKHGTHNSIILKIVVGGLIVFSPLVGFLAGVRYQSAIVNMSSDSPTVEQTSSKSPQPERKEYISGKKGSSWRETPITSWGGTEAIGKRLFKDFTLHYPNSWSLKVTPLVLENTFDLTLTKGSAQITIARKQGVGKGDCYYPSDNHKKEGMEEVYLDEYQVQRNDLIWKVGKISYEPNTYEVCEEKGQGYSGFTSIGVVRYSSSTAESADMAEFKEILEYVEIKDTITDP